VVADADAVGGSQLGPLDPPPVHEGPVAAAAVDDLVAGGGVAQQLGMVAGDRRVPDDHVVVGGPAQSQRLAGQRLPRPVGLGRDSQLDPVVGVAEAQPQRPVDPQQRDPAALVEGAVGAADVLQDPAPPARPQHQVAAGDLRVGNVEVGFGVAADGHLDGWVDDQLAPVRGHAQDRTAAHVRNSTDFVMRSNSARRPSKVSAEEKKIR
jgi:hypothetical protein